jgi:hypothetical protein
MIDSMSKPLIECEEKRMLRQIGVETHGKEVHGEKGATWRESGR